MICYQRYFRITSGPLIDVGRAIMQARYEAAVVFTALCKEIGAKSVHTNNSGSVVGFAFDTQPDGDIWGKPNKHGLRMPRKNTQAGKKLNARIDTMPKAPDLSNALTTVGLSSSFPVILSGGMGYSCVAYGAPGKGVMFVNVPWRDIDPQELSDYKRQRESKNPNRVSVELDHLLWTPSDDMIEVKEWEVLREIGELNAALKSELAA